MGVGLVAGGERRGVRKTSVADEVVAPRWLQVPKCDRAITTGQRSAAQNGQDSSLTKHDPRFAVDPERELARTGCSEVAA